MSALDRASVAMRAGRSGLLLGAGVLLLAGCATAYVQGQADLRGGRPAEARRHFEEALARRPDSHAVYRHIHGVP